MSHCTMLYKYVKHAGMYFHNFILVLFLSILNALLIKQYYSRLLDMRENKRVARRREEMR